MSSCMPASGCSSPLQLCCKPAFKGLPGCPTAGEIFPQAVCQHHGLVIGAYSAWFVRLLMLATAPVSWPISKVLDYLLGEDNSVSSFSDQAGRLSSLPGAARVPPGQHARACLHRQAGQHHADATI